MSDAQTAVALLIVDYLGAKADDVLIDWYLDRPSNMVRSNFHSYSDPFEILAKI